MEQIKLIKNNQHRSDSDIEWINEFYEFLQGEYPKCMTLKHQPKLSQKKAFSIIYYLQEHFPVLPDNIEKCDTCGELYESDKEGIYWETKGKNYCGGCCYVVPYNYDRGRKSNI